MHAFKVGDKGRTRGGDSYEVIAVEPRGHKFQLAVLINGDRLACRYASGSASSGDNRPRHSDLLPPTRTKYVNLVVTHFRGSPVVIASKPFDSADQAQAHARTTGGAYAAIAVPVEAPA